MVWRVLASNYYYHSVIIIYKKYLQNGVDGYKQLTVHIYLGVLTD